MKTFNWCGYEWISQERWGQIHEDNAHQYYSEDCVRVGGDGYLYLSARNKPKDFELERAITKEKYNVTSPIAVGLVSCTERLGYGNYKAEVKLPKGSNLFTAFWMWSWDDPNDNSIDYAEIDVFEGYTNKKGSYFKFNWKNPFGIFRVESNLHYETGENGNKRWVNVGAIRKFFSFKSPSSSFKTYEVDYTPNYIEVRYDGHVIRRDKDYRLMKEFGSDMNVLFNHGFKKNADWKDVDGSTDMVIRNFEYKPLENGSKSN